MGEQLYRRIEPSSLCRISHNPTRGVWFRHFRMYTIPNDVPVEWQHTKLQYVQRRLGSPQTRLVGQLDYDKRYFTFVVGIDVVGMSNLSNCLARHDY